MTKNKLLIGGLIGFSIACLLSAPYFGAADYSEQIHDLRMPRAFLAWICGGALAVAGLLLQSLLRNDLATPFTLGVASSASFGSFLCVAMPALAFTIWLPQLMGFGFALLTLLIILRLTTSRLGSNGILLVGITLNFIFGAALMIIRHLAPPYRLTKLEHWLMGSIETSSYQPSTLIAAISVVCLFFAWRLRSSLDQYSFDVSVAEARGVNPNKLLRGGLIISGLLTASVVSQCGPISFIGLLVPHMLRPFIGYSHALMICGCWLLGSGFLVLADTLSRSLLIFGTSSDIPVGIITATIGGPVFLTIILRKSVRTAH
ncbi:MAG: iron ABC transporter permease [Planctomycetota bacterium]|jgi:iron complex transport system permease protein|nr:iron ABC transporter permease [Planctomycetota bacterium]